MISEHLVLREEKKLMGEIKRTAKLGQMVRSSFLPSLPSYLPPPSFLVVSSRLSLPLPLIQPHQQNACKIMAKDLVRTRRYIQKFYAMRTQLQAVSLRIQTLRSNQQMGEAMKGATKAMGMMNRQMNLPQVSGTGFFANSEEGEGTRRAKGCHSRLELTTLPSFFLLPSILPPTNLIIVFFFHRSRKS